MKRVLFVGNFLSKKYGTIGPSESIYRKLTSEGFLIILASTKNIQLIRFFDIINKAFFCRYSTIQVDVFSGRAFIFAYLAVMIGSIRKKRIILTLHGGMLPIFYFSNVWFVNTMFQRAQTIQTPSLYLKNYFETKGFVIKYLPNPISLLNFPYGRFQVKKNSILWVRAFAPIYNPNVSIIVLEKLLHIFPDATLTMVGPDKGELEGIKLLIDTMGIANSVNILGPIPNDELYKYYQSHAVYINTTSYESFGVALIEAASCGVPIVSNDVGEVPFLWRDGWNILLVKENNIDQYINNISIIFRDSDFSNRLSENARKNAELFDWLNVRDNWIEILK